MLISTDKNEDGTRVTEVVKSFLTHCIVVDSSTVICWKSPFPILGVSGLFCRSYPIFDEKSC